jgi:hypothetical protein
MSYAASVTIHAPLDLIWSNLIDVEHWPESTASITSVERLDHGSFQVGSRARVRQPKLPTVVWHVTDLQPLREFTWVVTSPGVSTIARHKVEPARTNEYTLTLSIDRTGLLAPLIDRLYAKLTRTYVDMEAAGLKRVCEAAAQIPAPAA